jgi:hypothetical protein
MRRQWILIALFSILALGAISFPSSPSLAVITTDPERQANDLPVVKKEILNSTQYSDGDIDVVIKNNHFVVTVINSKLNKASSSERESEAATIVSAIEKTIASRPEFGTILGIHINYVAKDSGTNHSNTVDGIDFRKDPAGNFVHHKT